MSDPRFLPENTPQAAENVILFSDWAASEKSPIEDSPLFDGKIIARMPDLGSELAKNSEKPKTASFEAPSFWENVGSSISSMIQGAARPASATRQQFFHRLTSIGCVVLLCGIGILLLERGNVTTESTVEVAEKASGSITKEGIEVPVTESLMADNAIVVAETAFSPILQPEMNAIEVPTVPAGNFTATPNSAVAAAGSQGQGDSVWDRPAGDSYSPWNVSPKQTENMLAETPAAVPSRDSGMEWDPVSASAMSPATVAMTPMMDMSMPVSPYEQPFPLVAQSNPSFPSPGGPFLTTNNSLPPGMMPMHGHMEPMPNVAAAPNNVQRPVSPPIQPHYLPPSALQGMHAQQGQQNMPIPSAASALSQQGTYYQHPGGGATFAPPPNDFFGTPQPYRRMY